MPVNTEPVTAASLMQFLRSSEVMRLRSGSQGSRDTANLVDASRRDCCRPRDEPQIIQNRSLLKQRVQSFAKAS